MEGLTEKVGKGCRREAVFVMCAGVVLSFNSGYIQGCCLSGLLSDSGSLQQSVSGVTSAYTNSGLALADGVVDDFGFQIGLVLSFMFGCYLTGLVNPESTPHQLGPTYAPLFLMAAALMTISSVLSMLYPGGKSLFYFACAANGLQNGLASIYSGNLIRLSHTGSTTDMGTILGQVTRGNRKNLWKLYFLTALVSAFWVGGLISFWAARRFQSFALVASAIMFFLIGFVHTSYIVVTEGVSFTQALSGRWKWERALEGLNLFDEDGGRASDSKIFEIFDAIDEDKNGTLDEQELMAALDASGMDVSEKDIRSMIRAVDENNDGVIDKDEFRAVIDLAHQRRVSRSMRRSSSVMSSRRSSLNGTSCHSTRGNERPYARAQSSSSAPPSLTSDRAAPPYRKSSSRRSLDDTSRTTPSVTEHGCHPLPEEIDSLDLESDGDEFGTEDFDSDLGSEIEC